MWPPHRWSHLRQFDPAQCDRYAPIGSRESADCSVRTSLQADSEYDVSSKSQEKSRESALAGRAWRRACPGADDGRHYSPTLEMSVNMNDARMKPIRFESRDQTGGRAPRSPLVANGQMLERRALSGLNRLPYHPAPAVVARNWAASAATNVMPKSVDVSATPRLVVGAPTRWGDA